VAIDRRVVKYFLDHAARVVARAIQSYEEARDGLAQLTAQTYSGI
jgi:hypothetical protein